MILLHTHTHYVCPLLSLVWEWKEEEDIDANGEDDGVGGEGGWNSIGTTVQAALIASIHSALSLMESAIQKNGCLAGWNTAILNGFCVNSSPSCTTEKESNSIFPLGSFL